jgi:hypothetical protein
MTKRVISVMDMEVVADKDGQNLYVWFNGKRIAKRGQPGTPGMSRPMLN